MTMKKVIKSKKVLFKCSQSFNQLLDLLWRSKKIQKRFSKVNSKSDLIRSAVLNAAIEEYPDLIYLSEYCPEVNEYLEKSVDEVEHLLKKFKNKEQ
jgi:hypothetical protein